MIRIAINGILGRMGRKMTGCILKESDLILVGGIDTLETFFSEGFAVCTEPLEILEDCDVVVDFSSSEGLAKLVSACLETNKPLISGTTGLSEDQTNLLHELAARTPVVQATNFTIGINMMVDLLQKIGTLLGDRFDGEIVEAHHRTKADAPSGTSHMLAKTLLNALGLPEEGFITYGRREKGKERGREIGIHSLRGGAVIGEHHVHLFCENETLTLTHKVHNRQAFVDGVMRAIRWIPGKAPGLYTMQNVLDLRM